MSVVVAAYDFRRTTPARFDVNIWHNETFANRTSRGPPSLMRVTRSLNMVTVSLPIFQYSDSCRVFVAVQACDSDF